jgi:hypothetical protein
MDLFLIVGLGHALAVDGIHQVQPLVCGIVYPLLILFDLEAAEVECFLIVPTVRLPRATTPPVSACQEGGCAVYQLLWMARNHEQQNLFKPGSANDAEVGRVRFVPLRRLWDGNAHHSCVV